MPESRVAPPSCIKMLIRGIPPMPLCRNNFLYRWRRSNQMNPRRRSPSELNHCVPAKAPIAFYCNDVAPGEVYMHIRSLAAAFAASVALPVGAAHATDLEVTHWWTSGGEAAAVAELAKAFDATGNKWVDGAIAGSGSTARPIMISRITGGDPMAATQFNHGRQAEELVEAGLMRDLTDLATAEGWADVVAAPALLESCTLDGKIYCVPVNIHSWQWMWLSEQGVRGGRRAGPDQLGGAGRRRAEAARGRQDPARRRRRALAAERRLQRADERARRQGAYAARSSTRRTPRSPPAPRSRRSSRRSPRPARCRRAGT